MWMTAADGSGTIVNRNCKSGPVRLSTKGAELILVARFEGIQSAHRGLQAARATEEDVKLARYTDEWESVARETEAMRRSGY